MKKRNITLYLFFIWAFSTFGQDSSYKLMTVDGKNIGGNTYRYIKYDELNRIGKGILNGQEIFLDTLGNVVLISPYENMIWGRISNTSGVRHLYGTLSGKWAVLNSHLEAVTPFEYDKIEEIHTEIAKVRKNGLWGAVDTLGNQIVPCKYDVIDRFTGDFTIVRNISQAEAGVIYKNGKLVVPMTGVNELRSFHPKATKLIAVQLGWRWGIIDNTGKEVLAPKYYEIYVADNPKNPFSPILLEGFDYGAINISGQVVIEPKYKKINIFPGGAITIGYEAPLYSFFNSKGELKLTSERKIFNNDTGIGIQKEWTTYYYNYEGELIGTKNNEPDLSQQGSYYDENSDLFGYSDGKKLIIPCQYDHIESIDDSYFEVWRKKKKGIIDINNKVTLPIKYDYIDIIAYNRCIIDEGDKSAISDWCGKKLTPLIYYNIESTPFDSTLFIVTKEKENKWGIRNIDGKQVVPDIYSQRDSDNRFSVAGNYIGYGYYLVLRDGKFGILNARTYKEDIPCKQYPYVKIAGDNVVVFRENEKVGAIVATAQGLKTIPYQYDRVTVLKNGAIVAQKNGKWGVIDENNNVVIPFENKIIEQYYNDILIVGK